MLLAYILSVVLYTPPCTPKISPAFEKWLSSKNPNALIKIWVFFTDKGIFNTSDYENAIKKAEQSLTPKARARRLISRKRGELCDFSDLPVCKKYISELKSMGCNLKSISKWLNGATFVVKVREVKEIAKKPWVRKIELVKVLVASTGMSYKLHTKGINYGYTQEQLDLVHITEVHEKMGYSGKGVLIGVLDTGFEWRRNKALPEIKVVAEYDFIGNDDTTSHQPDQKDTVFVGDTVLIHEEKEKQIEHGTHMLSLLAAKLPGEEGFVGAAFGASFALAKTELLRHPATGDKKDVIMEEDWWIRGVEWCDSIGVDIISSSLGYKEWYGRHGLFSTFAYDSLDGKHYKMSKVASGLWEKGILLVTAMGNRHVKDADPCTCIKAPADADSILAVGGVDTAGKWIYWETIGRRGGIGGIKGPRVDGVVKPEVCGPWIGRYGHPFPYSNYDSLRKDLEGHGSSIATAIVAGACALVKEAHPDWGPMEIRRAIIETASHASSPNDSLGYGIVNVKKAIGSSGVPAEPWDRDKFLPFYPLPFHPLRDKELVLPYQLVNNTYVTIRIYTLSGKLIWEYRTPEEESFEVMGHRKVKWDGKNKEGKVVGSGIYVCLLKTMYGRDVKKIAVVR